MDTPWIRETIQWMDRVGQANDARREEQKNLRPWERPGSMNKFDRAEWNKDKTYITTTQKGGGSGTVAKKSLPMGDQGTASSSSSQGQKRTSDQQRKERLKPAATRLAEDSESNRMIRPDGQKISFEATGTEVSSMRCAFLLRRRQGHQVKHFTFAVTPQSASERVTLAVALRNGR